MTVEQKLTPDSSFHARDKYDQSIFFISNTNQVLPLGRVSRLTHSNNSTAVIPNDGFTEFKTVNKTTFDPTLLRNLRQYSDLRPIVKNFEVPKEYPENQAQIQTHGSHNISMINQSNFKKEIIDTKRPFSAGGISSSKNCPDEDRMYLMTTNQQFYDKPPKEDAKTFVEKNE